MKIGIIDADLIGREKHRHPNLVCEKISAYYKERGDDVDLLMDYNHFEDYDKVFISKVFTDTPIPDNLLEVVEQSNGKIHIGGTGFYFDKAPNLPDEIEHHMPDYNLYDEWIEQEMLRLKAGAEAKHKKFNERYTLLQFKEYLDYSIGFMTRGCFRKCGFCVNQKYDHVFIGSPLNEFYDPSRKKIYLLDDNFLGCPQWKELLQELQATNKPFRFSQGLDVRLLTDEKAELLFNSKYDGDFIFAFDNIGDYELIKSKLEMLKKYKPPQHIKFYVLVGYESIDAQDIVNAFERIKLLAQYGCYPYIMRYQNKESAPWKESKYKGMYIDIAGWCNQPPIFTRKSFREFCYAKQAERKGNKISAPLKAMLDFEAEHPDIAQKYFDLKFEDLKSGGDS